MLANINPDDFSDSATVDDRLMVRFFNKDRPDNDATIAEGRPIYREVEYVEIRVPGNRDVQACRPATHADKQRFPRHYDAFKRRIEAPTTGTPLAEWAQISRSQVEELAFMNVKTVEQLAEMADNYASRLHGGNTLKSLAASWLKTTDQTKLVAENAALLERLAAMEAKLEALQSTVTPDAAPPITPSELDREPTPTRRKRRPKAAT